MPSCSPDLITFRLVGVPISACPSDDEAAADKELEDMIMTRCYGDAGKVTGEFESANPHKRGCMEIGCWKLVSDFI